MSAHQFLAFDLGASSGRAILGKLINNKLTLTEVHRFKNEMTRIHGSCYWNIYSLFEELKKGLGKCVNDCGVIPDSIGIDTWGVDYALLLPDGRLSGLPYAYRDHRTDKIMEDFFRIKSRHELYKLTGIQFLQFNTLFQLFASVRQQDPAIQTAEQILFIPDVLNYFFTGIRKNEYTIASTSQLLKPGKAEWEHQLITDAGIPKKMFGEIIQPGTVVGNILSEICEQTGCSPIPCVAVASHDTASAIVSVPAQGADWAYLSSGTWSLLGIETKSPLTSDQSMAMNFTNEGGVERTTRYLKNIMGMWLIQECKRTWDREEELSWQQIVDLCHTANPFVSFIDPDSPQFLNPDNMPEAIQSFCRNSNQPVPQSKGEIARCIYDSLVLKYRYTLQQIEQVTGKNFRKLHIIGGGAHNSMMNQLTASAMNLEVVAGPAEATAVGNLLMQAKALGVVHSLDEIRQIVSGSFDVVTYNPESGEDWGKAFERFKKFL